MFARTALPVSPAPALALGLLFCALAPAEAQGQATVYIVRHAEKESSSGTNPPLTAKGKRRAAVLDRTLRSVPLRAIYVTEYQRTQQTVAPIARRTRIEPKTIESKATKALATALRAHRKGEAVLVSGHSFTIPDLLRELGVKAKVSFGGHDDLFVVVLQEGGDPLFLHLHYGVSVPVSSSGGPPPAKR